MSRSRSNRIHLDCRQYGVSGIGTYIENLVDQFQHDPADFEFHLLVRSEHREYLAKRLKFELSDYNETIYSVKEQFSWVTKIDPLGILHVPHYNAPLLFPGKLIITVHDVCHLAMKQYFPGILKSVYSNQFFKRILLKADHIVTVSEFSKSEITRYFEIDPDKISVIYNGVSPSYGPVPKQDSDIVLKKYHLPSEYILYLGNIKPHKNIQGVLSSYRLALNWNKDLPPLVILGNNVRMFQDIPKIKDFLADKEFRKKVIFTGYLPNAALPSVYSRALLFLFPSFYEGFGLTVLEAMASGTPVITSNCSAIPEIVNGAALLVNPYDDHEIAQQIISLAENTTLQKDLVKRGLKQVKQYSWKTSAKAHLEIYRRLLLETGAVSAKSVYQPTSGLATKRKILFLDQYGDRIGGGQVILLDILEKFRSTGKWEVYVSVPEQGKFTDLLQEHGFRAEIIKTWQPMMQHQIGLIEMVKYVLSSVKSSYFLGKLIKKHGIEVVYCNGGRTFLNGTFLSMLFSLKLFFHLHLLLEDRPKNAVIMFGRTPGVKSIFAVSKMLEQQYTKYSIHKKIRVVSNWVSPELIKVEQSNRSEKIMRPIRLGVVGQISKVKGQWSVLDSLLSSNQVLPITLSLYGEPLLNDIENWHLVVQMIEEANEKGWEVHYKGFQNDKLQIYDNLDVLIIPSFVPESFGLTAIEAMSRGVVVIANRSGALTEIIENNVNGILYDAHQRSDLIEILTKITDNQLDIPAIRKRALETVFSKYHPEIQLEALHEVVDNC